MHFRAYLPDISQNSEGVIRSVVKQIIGKHVTPPRPRFRRL